MKTSDFFYDLPEELIAQTPLEKRETSRLLRLDRNSGEVSHNSFFELPELLSPGDLLVFNDSKVLSARLIGVLAARHINSAGAMCELLLLRAHESGLWECIVRPGRKLREGAKVSFGSGELTAEIMEVLPEGNRLVSFTHEGVFLEILDRLGEMPLPPYIHEKLSHRDRYQTVYARVPGSAAAPTAGLHFTDTLLTRLKERQIGTAYVTLHVGLGTFRPVKTDEIAEHHMHREWFTLPAGTADAIKQTRAAGGRVIAVGTTVCRTLESCAESYGTVSPRSGDTAIFITPGYEFKAIDGLITNFHLPESTLIMLVSALAGREHVLKAYEEAIEQRYRFFSFGDAMLIL